MKIAFFNTKKYDREFFDKHNSYGYEITYLEAHLNTNTARLATDCYAVCAFVNDKITSDVLSILRAGKTRVIALRQ